TTVGSSAAPTAVTNRPISPTPRRGRPCGSTPEGTREQRRPRLPAQTRQRQTRQRQTRQRQTRQRQTRQRQTRRETSESEADALDRGVAVAPTTPNAGAVKYSARFECYARAGMVTASTAGV